MTSTSPATNVAMSRATLQPMKTTGSSENAEPSHVVGVGGSAGSLDALERFFRSLRADTSMTFIVLTHRDPAEKGMMVEILARFTKMRVMEPATGKRLERGVVYVVPSNRSLELRSGRIRLSDRGAKTHPRFPIDALFRTIARDCRNRSVGVVLSGMGADGTAGISAIKEAFGLALAQLPDTAAYDAMPQSVIASGLCDIVDAPEELAKRLDAHAQHERMPHPSAPAEPADALDAVLEIVRSRIGNDFSQYKKSTLRRRIARRMSLRRVEDFAAYVELLERDPVEVDHLQADLLIGVTRFFRAPDVFEAVKEALPSLIGRLAGRPLRAWVAGCASGEEAYSLAIAIREYIEDHRSVPVSVQIYATDLDQAAIARARAGVYPRAVAADLSRERLARFFVVEEKGYRVKKEIRDMIVFAAQNLAADPPFTKLDILSCRNVLIYLEPALQKKILPLFLYALVPGGLLLLGPSEGVSGFEDGFKPLRSDLRIFERRPWTHGLSESVHFSISGPSDRARANVASPPLVRRQGLPDAVERIVLEQVAPPVIVVDKTGTLLFTSRAMGRFLELPGGKASFNVFTMAREGLALPLRSTLRKALARGTKVVERGVRMHSGPRESEIDLIAWPVPDGPFAGSAVIAFVDVRPVPVDRPKQGKTGSGRDVAAELRRTKIQLASVLEEMTRSEEALRTVNEELRKANEELQSTNEELQSTNEELTTSKEEMQSMNEELLTLNAELQHTNEQLANANDDMRNLLNSSQIPTLFLDNELRLKRYTAEATRIARLIPSDIGRPVTDLVWSITYERLARDVSSVLKTLTSKEINVGTPDGATYTMRIHPYRTIDDVVDGVVITFMDITAYQKEAASMRVDERSEFIERAIAGWPGIAYVEDVRSGRSLAVSMATEKLLGYPRGVLAAATEAFWRRVVRGKRARYREHTVVLAKGADGRPTSILHYFRRRPSVARQ